MTFTQYKFSPVQISEAASAAAAAMSASNPGTSPALFAAQVVAARLRLKPAAYLEFGPYWWAVKRALLSLGHDFGPQDDVVIRAEYGASLQPYSALVAGEQFRDYYRATFLSGNAQFWLDDEGDLSYVLADPDMENRRHGLSGVPDVVVEEDGAPLLDGAHGQAVGTATHSPFAIEFELDGDLWHADVYAQDRGQAQAKVSALEAGSALALVIDSVGDSGRADCQGVSLFIDSMAHRLCDVVPHSAKQSAHVML